MDYSINYKLVNRDGNDYFAVDTATADFTCEMVHADIKNILGDNKKLDKCNFLLCIFFLFKFLSVTFNICKYS